MIIQFSDVSVIFSSSPSNQNQIFCNSSAKF